MIGICEVHESQRQTFENVFLIYKTARSPTHRLARPEGRLHEANTSDAAKIVNNIQMNKLFLKKLKKIKSCRQYNNVIQRLGLQKKFFAV